MHFLKTLQVLKYLKEINPDRGQKNHLLSKYLLSADFVPSAVLGAGDTHRGA